MKICVFTILNKILEFYGKNKIKEKIEVNDIYDNNTDYNELKKTILIELVIKRYNLKKSNLLKLRHSDLVDILVSKNKTSKVIEEQEEIIKENIVKLDEKIMTLEYEEPEIRNENEIKSKLLKIGSELHIHLTKIINLLDKKGFKHTGQGHNMGLHTEVLNDSTESLETYLHRVAALEGRRYNIKDKNNYDIVGRAIVFLLGELEGYEKDAKVTILFLPDGNRREEALKIIHDNI